MLRGPEINSKESIYRICHTGPPGGIFKLLRSPEIYSKESIRPAYVAWRAGTRTLFLLGSWPP